MNKKYTINFERRDATQTKKLQGAFKSHTTVLLIIHQEAMMNDLQFRLSLKTASCIFIYLFIFLPNCVKYSFTLSIRLSSAFDILLFMVALCNRADHYIFILFLSFFLLSSFFLRLISAVGDWMSTILRHMVWS